MKCIEIGFLPNFCALPFPGETVSPVDLVTFPEECGYEAFVFGACDRLIFLNYTNLV